MVEHVFGGDWTEVKLEILKKYLSFYTTAFKNQFFDSIYIDAFAGTGERQKRISASPLLKESERIETLAGSAKIALSVNNPFAKYIFIEKSNKRLKRLKEIAKEFNDIECDFLNEDANIEIKHICEEYDWKKTRAVLFLDPYGLEVNWNTLKIIQRTEAIDVWYLFPLSGLYRQAAIHFDKIEPYKIKSLNDMLGGSEWQEIFYSNEKPGTTNDLFDNDKPLGERTATVRELENYIKEKLSGVFPYVGKPIPLYTKSNAQLYSLFLCVSNPKPSATSLAKKVHRSILKGMT